MITLYTAMVIIFDYKIMNWFPSESAEARLLKRKEVHKRSAERLLSLALENGCIFVKAGQIVASMNHILPKEYTETLAVCQDKAQRLDLSEVRKIVRSELGFEIED